MERDSFRRQLDGILSEHEHAVESVERLTRERDEAMADHVHVNALWNEAERELAVLRARLRDLDERLARVAVWDTEHDKHGRPGPWCACCESCQRVTSTHTKDCPLHGWEPTP